MRNHPLQRLKSWFGGRQWVVLYHGSDEKRYARLVQQLTAAGIEHQNEEFDQMAKAMTASPIPGRSPLDTSQRRDQLNFSSSMTVLSRPLREDTANTYRVLVRGRDLARARRL